MRKIAFCEFSIFYNVFGVWDAEIENVCMFLHFGEERWDQGFAWNPGNVNFITLLDCSHAYIEIWEAEEINLRADTVRAIVVPFSVGQSGIVLATAVASIEEEVHVPISEGNYALVFEMKRRENGDGDTPLQDLWGVFCRLTFIPATTPVEPEILRADEELSPTYPLIMGAELA